MRTRTGAPAPVRHRLRVRGVVQGVGFRPFVYRLASELDLVGEVGNDPEGVLLEIEGPPSAVTAFEERLRVEAPPLARIDRVEGAEIAPVGDAGFRIVDSAADSGVRTFMPPDVAVCDDCVRELFDPHDRRYRYPFITCTNCGPRFTITARLPYDRPNTTMRDFTLCPRCAGEYADPADRRFHAQPLACADCGPAVRFSISHDPGAGSPEVGDEAVAAAQAALLGGRIVAVKGIGGYHLACDAQSDEAVRTLRARKNRGDKPLAVMVRDLALAEQLADIDAAEASLLTSPQRPIVLLRTRRSREVSSFVAPGHPLIGILLPYAPLHHLLFAPVPGSRMPPPDVLVMTSGNLGDEPICYDDADAGIRLALLADAWLTHDRPIHIPCDDSVMRVADGDVLPIRRSRGYAPLPIRLPFEAVPILAAGGELKNTFCMASGPDAWMSQHLGDMGSVETLSAFQRSVDQFSGVYEVPAVAMVADAHPGYHTRAWAETHAADEVELVQHHHAHIASVMVEHGLVPGEEVIGFAFDGTGYGTDGAIWGGEVLRTTYDGFERVGHLRYVPLPGGDATVRKPYRAALAHLWAAGIPWDEDLAPVAAASDSERAVLERQLERGVHCVPTSSMGRLFDAVSALVGVRQIASYEAEAAIELEALAAEAAGPIPTYGFASSVGEIDPGPVLRSIVDDIRRGCPTAAIAAGFHRALARSVADTADTVRNGSGLCRVALSGGVFQNVLLLTLVRAELAGRGFTVLTHRLVPSNDGGIALGQVAVAGRLGASRRPRVEA